MNFSVKKNIRGLFYGFFISLGLIFLLQLLIDTGPKEFAVGSIILYFVFVFEIYTSWFFSRRVLTQMDIPQVDTYSKLGQFSHHILLPTILYISYLGLIFFYHLSLPKYLIFIIAFITFSMLFINIRAYYEDKFKLEERSHYIYDIIKFILFFQLTNVFLVGQQYLSLPNFVSYILISILGFFILTIVIIRQRQLHISTIFFNLVASSILGAATFLLSTLTNFSSLAISIYILLLFYIFSAILHHKLEGSLNKEILLEYFAVLLLSLIIFQGLS